MLKACVKRKTRNLEKLKQKLIKIRDSKVESGYFIEQGYHPTAEMTYVELAIFHAIGSRNNSKRDIRPLAVKSLEYGSFIGIVKNDLYKYIDGRKSLDNVLATAGEIITETSQDFFGEINFIHNPPNSDNWAEQKGGNTPLYHYGYLRDAWSYKTSEVPTIRGLI